MSDPDHERSAALCRQAARPVLRQRPDLVIPKSQPDTESSPESDGEQPAPSPRGSIPRGPLGILDYGVWFRLPH
jgi:hypothetical protein